MAFRRISLAGPAFWRGWLQLEHSRPGTDTKGGHPIPMQQKTDKELETARVAIYPVDARGVAAPDIAGVTSADTTYTANVAIVSGMDADLSAGRRQEMLEIARATGGTAQFNNNISQALRDDFNRANPYYTVAYTPPDKDWQGAYHHVQISVDKPQAQLVYREGYYARSAGGRSEVNAGTVPGSFADWVRLQSRRYSLLLRSRSPKSLRPPNIMSSQKPWTPRKMLAASSGRDGFLELPEHEAKGKSFRSQAIWSAYRDYPRAACALVIQDVKRKADNPNKIRRDDLGAGGEGSNLRTIRQSRGLPLISR